MPVDDPCRRSPSTDEVAQPESTEHKLRHEPRADGAQLLSAGSARQRRDDQHHDSDQSAGHERRRRHANTVGSVVPAHDATLVWIPLGKVPSHVVSHWGAGPVGSTIRCVPGRRKLGCRLKRSMVPAHFA